MDRQYEMVIGLEVHVELKTKTKIFCGCSTQFGGEPNSQCCPICMGLPGTLPVLNEEVVNYGIQAGLATNCQIQKLGRQDRKHYFYPDLPRSYQVSQDAFPLCHSGYLEIETGGDKKVIGITQIHIEEDAGKLIHRDGFGTLVDYNRAGVPLIEIVSEPDLRSAEEVRAFLQKLRAIMLYIEVSDCKMNEGSFRCDVNLSVREKRQEKFGTRTEMKNLNSFQSIMRAIDYEFNRQVGEIKKDREIVQETRRYDQNTGKTYSMRTKEDSQGYRYMPDPDLNPIYIDEARIKSLRDSLPELPDSRKKVYMENYRLSSYDAEQIVSSKDVANYFDLALEGAKNPQTLANLMISQVFRFIDIDEFTQPFPPEHLAELVNLLEEGRINSTIGKKVIDKMYEGGKSPTFIVEEEDLEQISDLDTLIPILDDVIEKNQRAVKEYKDGKEKALQALIGQVMGQTKGKANPEIFIDILKERLKE